MAATLVSSAVGSEVDDSHLPAAAPRVRPGGHQVLADRDDGPDRPASIAAARADSRGPGQLPDEPGDEGAADVGIAVGRYEDPVALGHPADEVRGGLEGLGELAGQELLLDRATAGADDRDAGPDLRSAAAAWMRVVEARAAARRPDRDSSRVSDRATCL